MKRTNVLLLVLAGVASLASPAAAEIIEVTGCKPGFLQLGEGDNMQCILDPNQGNPADPDNGHTGAGGNGPAGGGGGGGSSNKNNNADAKAAAKTAATHAAKCQKCKTAADQCVAQAQQAEVTCIGNALTMAQSRCDIIKRGVEGTDASWGCSIWDLNRGDCTTAEPPWNTRSYWEWGCDYNNPQNTYQCHGPAVDNCQASWRVSHAGGSTTVIDTASFNATFNGVGGTANQQVTTSYTLTSQQGYLSACATVGGDFSNKCTTQQNKCNQDNACGP